MILSKHLTQNYLCNSFLMISPPKTVINGGNLKITEKLSEKFLLGILSAIWFNSVFFYCYPVHPFSKFAKPHPMLNLIDPPLDFIPMNNVALV